MSDSSAVIVVLVLWGVSPFLINGCRILGQKVCYIASGKGNVSWVTLKEFNITITLLSNNYNYRISIA